MSISGNRNIKVMSKRETYNLKFYKKVIENINYNICVQEGNGGEDYSVLTFLGNLSIQESQSFANDLALCLNSGGNIDEGFFSDSIEHISITYEYPNVNIDDILLISMLDMKSLLTEWIDFITP